MPENFDINGLAAYAGDNQVHGAPRPRADAGGPSANATTGPKSFAPVAVPPGPLTGPNPGYFVPMSGDPAARLPPPALAKLRQLQSAVRDLNAVVHAASDRLNDAQADLQRAEQRVASLRATNTGGRNDAAIAEARERADAARAARDHAQSETDLRSARAAPLREVLLACERFVERTLISVDEITLAPAVEVPTPKRGESWSDLVNAQRAKIEKAAADKQAALDAPWPSEHAKQRARQEIEQLVERGQVGVMALLESERGTIEWPQRYEGAGIAMDGYRAVGRVGRDGYKFDALPLIVWSNKDSIVKAIEREIDARADDRSALTAEQRAKKIAQAELLAYEAGLAEEKLIEQAELSGVSIQRRPDADVRCILSLSLDIPAPRGL